MASEMEEDVAPLTKPFPDRCSALAQGALRLSGYDYIDKMAATPFANTSTTLPHWFRPLVYSKPVSTQVRILVPTFFYFYFKNTFKCSKKCPKVVIYATKVLFCF